MTKQYPRINSKNAKPGQRVRSIPRDGQNGITWEGTVTSEAYRTDEDLRRHGGRAQYYVDVLKDGDNYPTPVHCQFMFIIQEAPVEV